jgi:hypothetical protein
MNVDQYIDLFRGRGDAYGSWDGGCVREPLTRAVFEQHLGAGPHIGVYCSLPVNGQAMCVWGCTDIDYDGPGDAWLLADVFAAVDIPSWVERTRRGFHVWVFAETLVPSENMRRMFLAAHQVAKLDPKEVNPKQSTLGGKGLGNYVRLPYHAELSDDPPVERRIVDRAGTLVALATFLEQAHATRVAPVRIAELADYYQPPAQPSVQFGEPSADMTTAAQALNSRGRAIWRYGPTPGTDRSTTLTRLAYSCADSGIAPADALMLLKDADTRWGTMKFTSRADQGDSELGKMIVRAYGRTPLS